MYTPFAIWWQALPPRIIVCAVCATLALLPGCDSGSSSRQTATAHADHDHEHAPGDEHDHDHGEEAHDDAGVDIAPPGTVPIPAQVRQNLGITFATVEMRRVGSTIRVPGRFEPLPSAVREYHAPLAGRVELLVRQYDHVTTGAPLYKLDSAEWRRMQQELLTVEAEVLSSSASLMMARVAIQGGAAAEDITRERIKAAEGHIQNLAESVKVAEAREKQVVRLQEIVGGRLSELNEARSQLAALRNELSQAREDRAELEQQRLQLYTEGSGGSFGTTATLQAGVLAREAEYQSARARRDLLRSSLLSILGNGTTATLSDDKLWNSSPVVTVHAVAEGIISELPVTSGGYVDTAAPILTTVDTSQLRFRATALQSDIQRLDSRMPGRILRPGAQTGGEGDYMPVNVSLGFEADPEKRTLDLVADLQAAYPWARAGVSTDLELVLDDTEDPETAIPAAAVIQDGLDKVFFRRSPENPDLVVRTKADLGLSDGQWVVVYSGVKAGDQVVLDGIYEMKLATADAPQKAGHFHADGTFHEEDH